jgi:hypothetical protein
LERDQRDWHPMIGHDRMQDADGGTGTDQQELPTIEHARSPYPCFAKLALYPIDDSS